MSGKPSAEGVKELAAVLRELSAADKKIFDLNVKISNMKAELNGAIDIHRRATRAIFDMMERMDVRSPGNAGYEERFVWFMTELGGHLKAIEP